MEIWVCHVAAKASARAAAVPPAFPAEPLTQLQPSQGLSALLGPICLLYGWILKKNKNVMTKLYRGNKLIIVPVDHCWIAHSVHSGPKEVYTGNQSRTAAPAGFKRSNFKNSLLDENISSLQVTLEPRTLSHVPHSEVSPFTAATLLRPPGFLKSPPISRRHRFLWGNTGSRIQLT